MSFYKISMQCFYTPAYSLSHDKRKKLSSIQSSRDLYVGCNVYHKHRGYIGPSNLSFPKVILVVLHWQERLLLFFNHVYQ